MKPPVSDPEPTAWYRGITGYQWLVLFLASAGWVFDVYEGQIFNLTRDPLLKEVLHLPPDSADPVLFGAESDMIVLSPGASREWSVYSVNEAALRTRIYRVAPEDWADYRKWLGEAGFPSVEVVPTPTPSTLVLAK